MTAPHIIDPAGMLGEALSQASPDLMRSLLQHVINALLSADADAVCGAQWGQQDPQRHTRRNGYRVKGQNVCLARRVAGVRFGLFECRLSGCSRCR